MKEKILSKLKDSAKTLALSVTISSGALGCIPAKIAELQQYTCSAETRTDIKNAVQGIVENSTGIDWETVTQDCVDDGKYEGVYTCSTPDKLKSTYQDAMKKVTQIQETNVYCPYGDSRDTTKAFVINGDNGNIFLNKPINDTCELQNALIHEAGHLLNSTGNFSQDVHNQGTDKIYMLGVIAQKACERNRSSKKINSVLEEINQFLKTPTDK